jgi:hypothetical protein
VLLASSTKITLKDGRELLMPSMLKEEEFTSKPSMLEELLIQTILEVSLPSHLPQLPSTAQFTPRTVDNLMLFLRKQLLKTFRR